MDSGGFLFDGSCHGNTLFVGNGDRVFRGPRSVLFSMEEALKNRPFFTAREEVEEDYYGDDRHLPEKKRRLTAEQVHLLERSFEAENKLEPDRKAQLARKLGLQPRQVAVWFQNRRARWKTKQLERDFDLLRSSYQSLIADYDFAIKENLRLKSEVMSLTEKLQAHEPVDPKEDLLPENVDVPPDPVNIKAEDRQSTGSSGGSAVVDDDDDDDDDDGPQLLVDSGDSYFPDDDGYTGCGRIGPIDGIQSEEEEEGSDDSRTYFVTAAAAEQQHPTTTTDDEPLGWFWS